MAELTLQVPDQLAQRIAPLQDRLPELLARLVETIPPRTSSVDPLLLVTTPAGAPLAYAEVLDFLITRPTPEEIAAFKVSAAAQERIYALLDKNREETLNETETAELNLYEQLEHLMILLKAKAHALMNQ